MTVTVSSLIALGQSAQVGFHLNRAMDNGLTAEEHTANEGVGIGRGREGVGDLLAHESSSLVRVVRSFLRPSAAARRAASTVPPRISAISA